MIFPPKYNETVGLQHCKVFVFDDDVLVSGANLSADYFNRRQDRYVLFKGCKPLADYFDQLVQNVAEFSFQLESRGGGFTFRGREGQYRGDSTHPYLGESVSV